MARAEPPQAVLISLQPLQEPRAVLNLVQAVLNSLQHLKEPRAVLNSLLPLGAQQSKTKQSKRNEDKAKQSNSKGKQIKTNSNTKVCTYVCLHVIMH